MTDSDVSMDEAGDCVYNTYQIDVAEGTAADLADEPILRFTQIADEELLLGRASIVRHVHLAGDLRRRSR